MISNFKKKIFDKLRVYFYYLITPKSRKFFFILIYRKFLNFFKFNKNLEKKSFLVNSWCYKKKILEKNFYMKIGFKKTENFFQKHRSFYLMAKLKEKNLVYKMGGMAHLNLIYNLIKCYNPKQILETGVAFGWSTLAIILSKSQKSNLISIDLSYPTKSSYKLVGMAIPSNLKKKFTLLSGIDYEYLYKFVINKKKFDFIHYDSDKSYLGRKKNYNLIWKILNKNGCFISDDISDNSAFYEFVTKKKLKYYILKFNRKYIGIVYK